MELKEMMIAYRAKEKISQAELAERTGLSPITISRIESGRSKGYRTTHAIIMEVIQKGDKNDTL